MSNPSEKIIVDGGGERLDVFLADYFNGVHTRSQIAVAIKNGTVTVNGAIVKAGTQLRNGDSIEVLIKQRDIPAEPEEMEINIVYEDNDLMVINKPRGLVVHPGAGNKTGTLMNGLLHWAKNEGDGLLRGGIVHRLDKNTAGLLVVAKTAPVQAKLSAMFEKREVKRVYVGLVEGQVKQSVGVIDKNIIRDQNRRTLFKTIDDMHGRRAVTRYKVLDRYAKWTLVQFELETGRTHQIRVHSKAMGHPIVGDPEYNPNTSIKASGQLLESVSLQFIHPVTGRQMDFSAELTEELKDVLLRLK